MDFSSHNPNTSNALNLAARNNDVESVKRLLKKMNPNCVDNRGWTCLHEAANSDSYECLVEILKHRDCRPLLETFEGYTSLYLACHRNCSLKTITFLLKSANDIVNYGSIEGFTPLHLACGQGRVELIQLLLEYGAMMDVKDFDGDTPLHNAVLEEQPEAIDALLCAGANPEIRNEPGGFTPFHLACGRNNFRSVELLFPFVTDINHTNASGCTSLMLAVKAGLDDVIKFLLEKGADPHCKNNEGEMVIDLALRSGNAELFKTILAVTARDKMKKSIILDACKPHYLKKDILGALLLSDLGPEFYDFNDVFTVVLEQIGHLKLDYNSSATLNSYLNICEYLYQTVNDSFEAFFYMFLMKNVPVNASSRRECPPLVYIHFCLHTPCFEVMFKMLVEYGCNVDYCSKPNCTDRNYCIPDAFLASLTSYRKKTTLLIMMPYTFICDPDRLIRFAHQNGVLRRIHPVMQTKLMGMIDSSFEEYEAERLAYCVPPLRHLCRLKVRSALRNNKNIRTTRDYLNIMNGLPLPPVIRNYLRYL